jgi:murein DD-endopeptidase MepM/ murein hydrolase activator NlpD
VELTFANVQGLRPLEVMVTPSPLQPGDVARVDIEGTREDERVTGSMLGQDLVFHFDPERRMWRALAGIDLDTTPGSYPLRIHYSGGAEAAERAVRIVPKQFRVRRLRVRAEFVEPPQEALEQIARDGSVLAAIYERVSEKKWDGPFVLPVDGTPTSNFGTRSYYNGQPRSPHAGVDFVGKPGTPIRAANRGEVAVAGPMYFTGNTVVIDYGDGLVSVFAHLSEIHVEAGATVEPSTIVGLVGATGRVTGPHLHWSVRLNGARVDPLSLMAAVGQRQ